MAGVLVAQAEHGKLAANNAVLSFLLLIFSVLKIFQN
jgi:hypothetical protein